MIQKKIAILGATGSIGTQALDVGPLHHIEVEALSANASAELLEKQIREFHPRFAALTDENAAKDLKNRVRDLDVRVFAGEKGLLDMIGELTCDTVVNAVIGGAGLLPTVRAIECGKNIALANKETLVCAGEYVMRLVREKGVSLLPIDSEHCAIFECLQSGKRGEVSKLVLTASGGPFFGYTREMLEDVTPERALAHPTWKMGRKITIDSATLTNKCFEMMEAAYLFDMPADKVDVVVHRESIVHSMVEYTDGAVIAQLAVPDMRMCIQYALSYPDRLKGQTPALDLAKIGKLTFFEPDPKVFTPLTFAPYALKAGGVLPAVLNGANETAVNLFLDKKIGFTEIMDLTGEILHTYKNTENPTLEEIVFAEKDARAKLLSLAGVS